MAATVAIADVPRPEAQMVIRRLKRDGLQVWMCTGDNQRTASVIAAKLGIDPAHVMVPTSSVFATVTF